MTQARGQTKKKSVSLGESVYQELSALIISGDILPGERLRETRIAERFGTSRVPVREALQRLDEEGWVVRVHGAGARVRIPTSIDIDELYDMRKILEIEAVRLTVRYLSLDTAEALRTYITLAEEGRRRKDGAAIADANRRFHAAVADLSKNALLADILHGLGRRVQWMFGLVALDRSTHSLQEHSDLIDAMLNRDVGAAIEITERHVESTRAALHAYRQD